MVKERWRHDAVSGEVYWKGEPNMIIQFIQTSVSVGHERRTPCWHASVCILHHDAG